MLMFRGVLRLFIALLFGMTLVFAIPSHALKAAIPAQKAEPLVSFPTQPGLPDPNTIFDTVNQARIANGLAPLKKDAGLAKIAQERAADMHSGSYYAHQSPSGLFYYDLMYQQHIGSSYSCENLDLQFVTMTTNFVNDWMNSSQGHRECMLNRATDHAGYAITTLDTGNEATAYMVVAIHASLN